MLRRLCGSTMGARQILAGGQQDGRFAMYDRYYGFTGLPFLLTARPHFFFESHTHRKAMSYLSYGLAQGEGAIVITGDCGSGKTTLIGHFAQNIDWAPISLAQVTVQKDGVAVFLAAVADALGCHYPATTPAEMLLAIEIYLRAEVRAGRKLLLIVDDAHHLEQEGLLLVQRLAALHEARQPLLQIFLLGQAELLASIDEDGALVALRQRIIARHHLECLRPDEVEPFVFQQLGKVGWAGVPSISGDMFQPLWQQSRGHVRELNRLLGQVFLYAAAKEVRRLDRQIMCDAIAAMAAGCDAPTAHGDHQSERAWTDSALRPTPCQMTAPDREKTGPDSGRQTERPAEMAQLHGQVTQMDAAMAEQDAVLRRVVDLLTQLLGPRPEDPPRRD